MRQSKELEQVKEALGDDKAKYMRPSECRSHMRRTLAREFQGIVEGFVAAAKKGSCPHVKLANELLKPTRKSSSRKKGTATKFWEMLQREEGEKEQLRKDQLAAERELQCAECRANLKTEYPENGRGMSPGEIDERFQQCD